MKIGLLGGSFNPPHEGHYKISLQALKQCQLDQIWWLITPQNPFKTSEDTLPFMERVRLSNALIKHPKIKVKQFEKKWNVTRTLPTLLRLYKQYPMNQFVWIMGGDNLATCHKWLHWKRIFLTIPIIVFDRGNYSYKAVKSKAATNFISQRLSLNHISTLSSMQAPAWAMLHQRKIPVSSTQIRRSNVI